MRYKKILVSGQLLVNVFTFGQTNLVKCIKGLPEGTNFAYSIPDTINGIWLVVSHSSFDELKDGDLIPEFPRPEMESAYQK